MRRFASCRVVILPSAAVALVIWSLVSPPAASATEGDAVSKNELCSKSSLIVRESAVTLIADQSTGSFAVSKTACVAERAYTFEMTDTYGDEICCQYGAGEFKITVNGEPGAISSRRCSGDLRRGLAQYWPHSRLPVGYRIR
jgi:hypothetical protein